MGGQEQWRAATYQDEAWTFPLNGLTALVGMACHLYTQPDSQVREMVFTFIPTVIPFATRT